MVAVADVAVSVVVEISAVVVGVAAVVVAVVDVDVVIIVVVAAVVALIVAVVVVVQLLRCWLFSTDHCRIGEGLRLNICMRLRTPTRKHYKC